MFLDSKSLASFAILSIETLRATAIDLIVAQVGLADDSPVEPPAVSKSARAYSARVTLPQRKLPPVPLEFGLIEWEQEVERYQPSSRARTQAMSARKAIEAGTAKLNWKRCRPESADGTRLPGCHKLYVPLGKEGASAAPYGFVFQLVQKPDRSLARSFLAFGERIPATSECAAFTNARTSAFTVTSRANGASRFERPGPESNRRPAA